MRCNHVYYGTEANACLFPMSGSEGNESDADITANPELTAPEGSCDNDSDFADLDEDIVELRPEIPGWEEYFKELNAMQ